jgi:hypothetical protein
VTAGNDEKNLTCCMSGMMHPIWLTVGRLAIVPGSGSNRAMQTGPQRSTLYMATFIRVHGSNISTDTANRLTNRNKFPPVSQVGAQIWDRTAVYLRIRDSVVVWVKW